MLNDQEFKLALDKVLNETPIWWDDHKNIGSQLGKLAYTGNEKIIKKESVDGYDWIWSEETDGETKLEIVKNNIVYGMFTFINSNIEKTLQVELAGLHPSLRGKGYAVKVYSDVINDVGGIMSDSTLTGESGEKGSFHVWERLSKKFNNTYIITVGSYDDMREVDDFNRDMMGHINELFVISKEPLGVMAESAKTQ